MDENKKKTTTSKTTKKEEKPTTTKKASKSPSSKKTTVKKDTKKVVDETKKEIKKTNTTKEKAVAAPILEEKIEVSETLAKANSEFKRLGLLVGILAIIAIIFIISYISSYKASQQMLAKVLELKASADEQIIYLIKDGCQYCELNQSNMDELKSRYGISYYEVDISKLFDSDYNRLLTELDIDKSNFGTPTLVITKNNEVQDFVVGTKGFDTFFYTLQQNNLIDKDAKLLLNYVDYDEYNELIKSDQNQALILASSTCHFCLSERPILDEIVEEYGIKLNWIYLDEILSTEDIYNEFMSSLDWFVQNQNWGTPTTLIIKNGQVESVLSGYRSKDDLISFYKQNNIISE